MTRISHTILSFPEQLWPRLDIDRTVQVAAAEVLQPWDKNHFMGAVKAKQSSVDAARLAEYFTLENCLEGLHLLVRQLFGMSFRPVPLPHHANNHSSSGDGGGHAAESWHPDVQKMALSHPTEGVIGHVYLDLYPRPATAKYDHCAHFTIQCPSRRTGRVPLLALVCNFSPIAENHASGGGVVLLHHHEVETLFHEFGHALHTLLSATYHHLREISIEAVVFATCLKMSGAYPTSCC